MVVVFIHGYSVSSFDTYGQLPSRMQNEARARSITLQMHDVYLARYISFNDAVRLDDLSAALESALRQEIYTNHATERFVCITHSTGGPLVRNWVNLFYADRPCPMSHLIMLAPANHGSALAQLGKGRLSRLRSWFNGMEPGQKILDWLELGSRGSWSLNKSHVLGAGKLSAARIFYFVLTGQDIDRKLYDHINSYTGETGSDGVVRAASANLNDTWLKLVQETPAQNGTESLFIIKDQKIADAMPFRILKGKSHSNEDMGIMRSVLAYIGDTKSAETIDAIFRCLACDSEDQYKSLAKDFEEETAAVQAASRVEVEQRPLGSRYYIHDRQAMVVFRLRDSEGHVVNDYDLLLTAGPANDPDDLPAGFFTDRQCNCKDKSTLTYYFNYDLMNGCAPVMDLNGKVLREARPGMRSLGLTVIARPDRGLVRYIPAVLPASTEVFEKMIRPNCTTLVEIVIKRLVSDEVLRLENFESAKGEWNDNTKGDGFIT